MHSKSSLPVPRQVFISLGSNLGRRLEALHQGVEQLRELSRGAIRCSAVYETAPVGLLEQPDFLNMVVEISTVLLPLQLLEKLHAIELAQGRERTIRFGPRTLDLDILLYNNQYVCFKDLQIPHPRMWERAFVMIPLAELEPQRRAPGGTSFAGLAESLSGGGHVRYVGKFW